MRKRWIVAGAAAIMMGLAACSGGSGGDPSGAPQGNLTLTLAPIAPAQPWDLKDAGLGHNTIYYQPVYDQLFRLDANADVQPNLATEWSYDDTQTKLSLTLRDDVTFTDGTVFDGEAVKANLLNTKTGTNEAAGMLQLVDSVDVVDATHVVVNLTSPDPSLVPNLGNTAGMMASPAAIGTEGLQTTPVGSGPYVLDVANTTVDAKYTFTRNPDYWNPDAFPFDKIVLTPLNDATAMLNALQAGQIDGGFVSDTKNVATLEGAGLNILTYPSGDVSGLYIWDRAGDLVPALGDVKVRQAINFAFDKDTIIKTAFTGYGIATTQAFNPDGAAFDPALNDVYTYDVAKAKDLMAQAGYADGFELTMPDLTAFNPGAQAAIVEQLGAIGITVKLDPLPLDQVIDALLNGKYAASYFQLASFRPWDTSVIQIPENALWNPFRYTDPTIKGLLDQASAATGAEQDAIFRDVNEYLVNQAWNAPWTDVVSNFAYSSKVAVTPQKFAIVPYLYNFTPAS